MKKLVLICFIQLLTTTGCVANSEKQVAGAPQTADEKGTHYHAVGQSEYPNSFLSKANQSNEAWDLTHEGSRLYREKKYDQALAKLQKALTLSGGDEWTIRSRLAQIYEAQGDYGLALGEVNWKIEQHPKEKVPASLIKKKAQLESLIATKQ